MSPERIGFIAPMKPPDHPVASGDRTMARLLWRALETAGCEPVLLSRLRMLDMDGDPSATGRLLAAATGEAGRILGVESARSPAARLRAVVCYHLYYKAPDAIGPAVAGALRVPYVVAEASTASKRMRSRWHAGHAAAEAAIDAADAVLAMTAVDREAMQRRLRPRQRLVDFPPFIDAQPAVPARPARMGDAARLVAVAMMRDGDKLTSYQELAEALGRVADLAWSLTIVGDGPARGQVKALFAPFGPRVVFRGLVEAPADLAQCLAESDVFVWPAVNEAYGMALLEAAAAGLPCVAGRFGGVPDVVIDGETGLVTRPHDTAALAAAVARLVREPALACGLGRRAAQFVRRNRSLDAAAAMLRKVLADLGALRPAG